MPLVMAQKEEEVQTFLCEVTEPSEEHVKALPVRMNHIFVMLTLL